MADPDDGFRRLCDRAGQEPPRVALVLGSGLGPLAERVSPLESVSFAAVPGLEHPTVSGHPGTLILGSWAGQRVLVFCGRVHFYEGHLWDTVVQPAHLARSLGAKILVLTNAAGGIRDDLVSGSLLALRDHVDCTKPWLWREPRMPEPSPYDAGLLQKLQDAASQLDLPLPTGVFAQVTGPCYETPAEVCALKELGVDAVGMSTAREARAGHGLGLACVALSCITNRAAGQGTGPIHHGEVLTATSRATNRIGDLLEHFLRAI